eukprot:scaffold92974_cov35-Tisochrysis_lutea.AAC.1
MRAVRCTSVWVIWRRCQSELSRPYDVLEAGHIDACELSDSPISMMAERDPIALSRLRDTRCSHNFKGHAL